MSGERSLELPEHVAAKVQKVLGISSASLADHELVSLIEDLCDTALMFDRDERGGEQTGEDNPSGDAAAATMAQFPGDGPVGSDTGGDSGASESGSIT